MYNCTSDENYKMMYLHVKKIDKFLSMYTWLTDAYVLDFFTESHWEKLPESWRSFLENISTDEISSFLSIETNISASIASKFPLSLLAFRKVTQLLSCSRPPISYKNFLAILKNITHIPEAENDYEDIDWKESKEEFNAIGGHHTCIDEVFRKHVKPKKQHEIYRLSKVVQRVLRYTNCNHVVDIGSGQGHLSRFLSFHCGFKVLTIEAECCHITGAKKIDQEVAKNLIKKLDKTQNDYNLVPPEHRIQYISPESDSTAFLRILQETWKEVEDFSIVGLHTCGNLSTSLLKSYVETKMAKSLISVGCCYMKTDKSGFPMSNFVKHLKISNLSYEAKEVSCHAIEIFRKRLMSHPELLRVHCYRATLEDIIVKRYPNMKRTGLRSIKHVENMTFTQYASKALSNHQILIPTEDFQTSLIESRLKDWKKVVVFYSLRLLLAPLIETLILLDRMLYLYEFGIASSLIPVFDPSLSPRNLVLISVK